MYYFQRMAVVIGLQLMVGCGKGTDAVPATDNLESILQSGDWRMTAFTVSPALNGVTDVYLKTPPCSQDNLLQFRANAVFYLDDGATNCDPADKQSDQGNWTYGRSIQLLSYASPKLGAFIINVSTASSTSISGTRSIIINGQSYMLSGTLSKQ